MFSKKEFDLLTLLEKKKESISQRDLTEVLDWSLGTVNKISKELTDNGFLEKGMITEKGIKALEPYRVQRAIFIAAGFGSRMVPITFNTPKPLVRVNGTRIIDTLLDAVVEAEIPEIVIVRGYLGEQFDQLNYKYKNIKFITNDLYNEANNISSALCVKDLIKNAYVLEADLVLTNKNLITKYQYHSNMLGIPVDRTDDWCLLTDASGVVTKETVGGVNCHQMVGISYWTKEDGEKLSKDIEEVFNSPGGKERYWEQVPMVYKKNNYKVHVRECTGDDIVEIDTFNELKAIDPLYAT